MKLIEILIIVVVHWVADFVLQTDKQAKGKSKNWGDLLSHTITYTLVWGGVLLIISIIGNHFDGPKPQDLGWDVWIALFLPITFIFHTVTDYYTSRLNSKLWANGDVHNFFVSVGFDQVLHYIQLFVTYYLLKL